MQSEVISPRTEPFGLLMLAKDEESFIPTIARSVLAQTVRPSIWLIVDDGSSDSTYQIARDFSSEKGWITLQRLPPSDRDHDYRFGRLCTLGLQRLMELLNASRTNVEFLIKVDADISLRADCFERLVRTAASNPEIGILGPSLGRISRSTGRPSQLNWPFMLPSEPPDGVRLYRVACLRDIGWIPSTIAPDVAALQAARRKGWKTVRFPDVLAWKMRRTGESAASPQGGYFIQGQRRAALGYSLWFVLVAAMLQVVIDADIRALVTVLGYADGLPERGKDQGSLEDASDRSLFFAVREALTGASNR